MRPGDIDRTGEVWVYRPERHEWRGQERTVPLDPGRRPFSPVPPRPGRRKALLQPGGGRGVAVPAGAAVRRPGACDEAVSGRGEATGFRQSRLPWEEAEAGAEGTGPRRSRQPPSGGDVRDPEGGESRRDDRRVESARLRHAEATEVRAFAGLEAPQATPGHERAEETQLYAEKNFAAAVELASGRMGWMTRSPRSPTARRGTGRPLPLISPPGSRPGVTARGVGTSSDAIRDTLGVGGRPVVIGSPRPITPHIRPSGTGMDGRRGKHRLRPGRWA